MPQQCEQSNPSRLICERCGEMGMMQHAGGKTRVYAKAYVFGQDEAECCTTSSKSSARIPLRLGRG